MPKSTPASPLDDPDFSLILLERLGQSAVIVLDNAGVIRYASERAERLLQAKSAELVNSDFFRAVEICDDAGTLIPERKNPVWQALNQSSFNQVTPFFAQLRQSNEEVIPLALRAIQLETGDKITGVIVEMRHVKRVLNVGEMKSLFVSFAAHQLKTPSSIVKGFLELMMREGASSYSRDQWYNLQSAFESNENLIHLSKTLLNLTRLEGGLIEPKIAPFDPGAVLKSKIRSHNLLLKVKGIKSEVTASPEGAIFQSDEMFFSEIFDTLFSNAIKYSPEGSTIYVTCTTSDDQLEVVVKDQGKGIPPEEAQVLFDSAHDSDPDQNSHGLGLLMAKKYVSLLGGTIGVRPEPSPGATLYFTLPKPLI